MYACRRVCARVFVSLSTRDGAPPEFVLLCVCVSAPPSTLCSSSAISASYSALMQCRQTLVVVQQQLVDGVQVLVVAHCPIPLALSTVLLTLQLRIIRQQGGALRVKYGLLH